MSNDLHKKKLLQFSLQTDAQSQKHWYKIHCLDITPFGDVWLSQICIWCCHCTSVKSFHRIWRTWLQRSDLSHEHIAEVGLIRTWLTGSHPVLHQRAGLGLSSELCAATGPENVFNSIWPNKRSLKKYHTYFNSDWMILYFTQKKDSLLCKTKEESLVSSRVSY